MKNYNTDFGKITFECDIETGSALVHAAKSKGYESINEYFQYLVDENAKNQLHDFSNNEIDEVVQYLMEGILDDESWELGESYFKSKPFTFVYAYKTLKSVDPDFPYPNWDRISKSSRILLGRTFKKKVLEAAEKVNYDEFFINLKDELLSNAALYDIRQKLPSIFGK